MSKQNPLIIWTNELWDSDLPSSSKSIGAYLRCMMRPDQLKAWPSVPTIASKTSLSLGTVRSHLKTLERKGWIKIVARNGSSNNYILIPRQPLTPSVTNGGTTTTDGTPSKVRGKYSNNIKSNIINKKGDAWDRLNDRSWVDGLIE